MASSMGEGLSLTAVARARTGKQWLQFDGDENKRLFPYIEWLPSRSATPRETHRVFWHCRWRKDDNFWKENQPGSLWNCKCDWEQTDENPTVGNPTSRIVKPGLDQNPATSGQIFTDTAPYIKRTYAEEARLVEDFFRPIAEHRKEYLAYRDNPDYHDVAFNWDNGGMKATHNGHNFDVDKGKFGIPRGDYETIARDALFSKGYTVVLMNEDSTLGTKQPDGLLNGKVMDIKGVEGNPMWSINRACAQHAEVCVLYFHKPTDVSLEDIKHKFFTELPEWREKQSFIKEKDMSVKTVVCVVNKNGVYDIHEIKKPGE